jgi:hypothetical protein
VIYVAPGSSACYTPFHVQIALLHLLDLLFHKLLCAADGDAPLSCDFTLDVFSPE